MESGILLSVVLGIYVGFRLAQCVSVIDLQSLSRFAKVPRLQKNMAMILNYGLVRVIGIVPVLVILVNRDPREPCCIVTDLALEIESGVHTTVRHSLPTPCRSQRPRSGSSGGQANPGGETAQKGFTQLPRVNSSSGVCASGGAKRHWRRAQLRLPFGDRWACRNLCPPCGRGQTRRWDH